MSHYLCGLSARRICELKAMEKLATLFAIVVTVATCAHGRVYYLENLDGARSNEAIYPIAEEQASRDLDLTFSAGDSAENFASPIRKVYTVVAPEKPHIELSRDADRPFAYYRLAEPAARRGSSLDDVVHLIPSQGGRKLMKLDNKGEVILELRVIANHDSS